MAVTVAISPDPILRFCDDNGNPLVGGSLLTQVGGVNYPAYSDAAGTTPLPNPIPLNSRGEVSTAAGASSQLFLQTGVTYTFTLYDAAGNPIWTGNSVTPVTTTFSQSQFNALLAVGLTSAAISAAGGALTSQIPTIANYIYKKTNTAIASNIAKALDPDLQVTLAAGVYDFEFGLFLNGSAGTNGGFNGTAESGGNAVSLAMTYGVANGTFFSQYPGGSGANIWISGNLNNGGNYDWVIYKGTVSVPSSQVFGLWWAQYNSSAASTTLYTGSYMKVSPLTSA